MAGKDGKLFDRLVEVMRTLRSPGGCPWDREQTLQSLKRFLVEETYECLDAIDSEDPNQLKDELGDLLLQIVFQSQIASEKGWFDAYDVVQNLIDKLIRRHPHVFGDASVKNAQQVVENWQKIKEKKEKKSLLDGLPKSMPSLLRAFELTQRAASVGFDWHSPNQVMEKLHEEVNELSEAVKSQDKKRIEEEIGDILFVIANLARHLKINPEDALQKTNSKFVKRFKFIESKLAEQGRSIHDSNLEEMDELWNLAKEEIQS